jgi:hypothetical protein
MGQSVKKHDNVDENASTNRNLKLVKDQAHPKTDSNVDQGIAANLAVIAIYKPLFGDDYSYAYSEHP